MAANKCSAVSPSSVPGHFSRDSAGQIMSLASAVAHLNAVSAGVSVEPADYSWGTPSMMQQQALYAQFLQLAFMCSWPQMQFSQFSGCPTLSSGRGAMFPGFMPQFAGFLPTISAPSPSQSPSPAPCSVAVSGQQAGKPAFGQAEPLMKVPKGGSPSKKSGSKAKASKGSACVASNLASANTVSAVKDDPDIELEDICRLLGDDAFLEHLQDDVLSEGSNGSSSTSDGRVLSKNNSNGSLSGSLNNNDGGFFSGNNFASAFDIDMDDLPGPAPTNAPSKITAPAHPPCKADSGDLNNMVASSPTKSSRTTRAAAREAAAAAKESAAAAGSSGHITKIALKTNKGGVHKTSGSKQTKAQAAAVAEVVMAATAAPPSAVAGAQEPAAATDCPLTAADLSRLLGEDDNSIPEGWDLDLDFENPFSCSISAF